MVSRKEKLRLVDLKRWLKYLKEDAEYYISLVEKEIASKRKKE